MTIISDSYNAIVTLIKTTLPNWNRLNDSFQVDENHETFLREGWALVVDQGVNNYRELCSRSHYIRSYGITLTIEIFGADLNETIYDQSISKIMEAINSLVIAIETDKTLGIGGGIVNVSPTGDSGILPLNGPDNRKFIMCELRVDIETMIQY